MTNKANVPEWAEEYMTLLDDCTQREHRLTDWEIGFVDTLRVEIEHGKPPSARQIEVLNAIWEKATAKG